MQSSSLNGIEARLSATLYQSPDYSLVEEFNFIRIFFLIQIAYFIQYFLSQPIDIILLNCRDENRHTIGTLSPAFFKSFSSCSFTSGASHSSKCIFIHIHLVEDRNYRLIHTLQIVKGLLHYRKLVFKFRMRNIHYMQQHISFADFIKRALEALYQMVRKFTNKPYSITEKKRCIAQYHFPGSGVQRSKKLILCKHSLLLQVHNSALPYIGVTNQATLINSPRSFSE